MSQVMSTSTYTVPCREGPHVAADHAQPHLHHVVVVDDHRAVGMGSFDLLKLS
ncbi:MAG: hypothetical protein R2702_03295 [Acidimicrobiales bacterium]